MDRYLVQAQRAAAILYNVLRARRDARPFLLPAAICPIMPITFIKAHQPFQLLDCDPRDRGMDQAVCLEALRRSPTEFAGVLYVRPYGALADCSGFFRAIRTIRSDLLIVDDRCLCQPDSMGTSCDPSADVTLYSTGYGKLVDLGAGGFAHLAESVAYGIESLRFDA
ncbi:MAG: hypothetical protein JNJ76_06630, partial [Candidatus Competibacter sp.]|nr:hypothetical protein [Candidatus Competibacter sp.]